MNKTCFLRNLFEKFQFTLFGMPVDIVLKEFMQAVLKTIFIIENDPYLHILWNKH